MKIRPTFALALAASALLLLPGCGSAADAGASAQPADVADDSLTPWSELEVGDCILETDWDSQLDGGGVQVVDCAQEHTDEVFAVVAHEFESFPGQDEILAAADEACARAFPGYVGASLEDSAYDFSYTAPSEATWDAGDRNTLCFVFSFEGEPLTGSVEDAEL